MTATLAKIEKVEKAIKSAKNYPTIVQLWWTVGDISYGDLKKIVDYLVRSHKVIFDHKEIVWVFVDNKKLKKLVRESVKVR